MIMLSVGLTLTWNRIETLFILILEIAITDCTDTSGVARLTVPCLT